YHLLRLNMPLKPALITLLLPMLTSSSSHFLNFDNYILSAMSPALFQRFRRRTETLVKRTNTATAPAIIAGFPLIKLLPKKFNAKVPGMIPTTVATEKGRNRTFAIAAE